MVDFFFNPTESVFLRVRYKKIPLGKSKNDLRCFTKSRGEIAQMAFEFRQNNSDEWRSFLKVNESGSFPTNNRNDINILSIGGLFIVVSFMQYICINITISLSKLLRKLSKVPLPSFQRKSTCWYFGWSKSSNKR